MRYFRRAEANDATSLTALYRQLHPYSAIEITPDRLTKLTESGQTFVVVCEENGSLLATASIFLCDDLLDGDSPFAVVDNFVVDQHYLREGIGKSLIDYIEQFCLEKNCSRICMLSDHENRTARDFITAMGYDPEAKIGFIKLRKYFGL